MDTFICAPTSHRMRNTQLVQDGCQFQIMSVATLLITFGSYAFRSEDYQAH